MSGYFVRSIAKPFSIPSLPVKELEKRAVLITEGVRVARFPRHTLFCFSMLLLKGSPAVRDGRIMN